ncbi:MAG: MBOAT family O-acyltransferase [Planctomycetaceae bacterium]
MLFSSYEFLLLFLPLTLLGFAVCRRINAAAARVWLLAASAVFYGVWSLPYLGLLSGSIAVNFALGRWLGHLTPGSRPGRAVLSLGVVFNLGLLGWFKYAGFLVESAADLFGTSWSLGPIILPLAISFFTFQQLAFLVDAYRSHTPTGSFVDYALFVLFFPQLIAGPIVQHSDILPQLKDDRRLRLRWESVAMGIALFVVGLFKKVVIADSLAPTADAVFELAASGSLVSTADAWLGTLAYTLQLYFDFSGYSDMAIGLGWLFGLRLPQNFNAPYQAVNIIDFWRRWHITLSQFLRDFLYIPLGGNRGTQGRRYANLFITMLLGGLWHGAGWTFILWGGLHGLYLTANHAWRAVVQRAACSWTGSLGWRVAARGTTFLAVMAGWVVFRADSLPAAGNVLGGLIGRHSDRTTTAIESSLLLPLLLLTIAVQLLPTIYQTLPDPETAAPGLLKLGRLGRFVRRPAGWHGAALAAAFLVCLSLLTRVKEFLYFQF